MRIWTMARMTLLGAGVAIALSAGLGTGRPEDERARSELRRPVALLLADEATRLLVANRDSGSISVIHADTHQIVQELRCGRRLSDMDAAGPLVFATDEHAGELVVLDMRDGPLRVLRRVKVPATPVGVRVSNDGDFLAVACLWPRRLVILDRVALRKGLAAMPEPVSVDLPFAPRHMLPLPGGAKMLVADAFGGELAVVDLARRHVDSVRSLPAHNMRGMALARGGKAVLVTHQLLYPRGQTVPGDIRSGNVMSNFVRRLALDVLLQPRADLLKDDERITLGDVEQGAGDPAGVAQTEDGRIVVALAGVNEVAIGQPEQALWHRLPVGDRPTALLVDPGRWRAYVANTLGDSVSVIDLKALRVATTVKLGAAPALTAEQRGEMLFHDARLSLEGWYSCHSCHTDGHTNGRLNDNFTDGSFGTPKRVLSLLGTRDTGPWAWNGHLAQLEDQVRTSVKSTMQGRAPSPTMVADLAAYLRTLAPPPSLLEARGQVDAGSVKRGRKVFTREKCTVCHTPPTYTSAKTYDVGMADEAGRKEYNPPSLRGVSQGGPYFHDGRAASLEEVFSRFGHELGGKLLSDVDLRDLVYFLRSL
jgi:YVTN family beta-propeller protein